MRLAARHYDVLEEICGEWRRLAAEPRIVDEKALWLTVSDIYHKMGLPPPEIIRHSSISRFYRELLAGNHDLHEAPLQQVQGPPPVHLSYKARVKMNLILTPLERMSRGLYDACLTDIPFTQLSGLPTSYSLCWIAEHQFMLRVGAKYDKSFKARLNGYSCIAENSLLCFMYKERIIFLDRPATRWDDQNRTHCESGPAIIFENDRLFYWHGVRVPKKVISAPHTQKIAEIHAEINQEVRRIRIERFGWQRYLQETEAETLDNRRNDIEGTTEALMLAPEGKILVCACPSTARVYALEVPYEITSCQQAQAWLSGGLNGRITAAT